MIFQGINCINCGKTILLSLARSNPVVDLREFYIIPTVFNAWDNVSELIYEFDFRGNSNSPLNFNFINQPWFDDEVREKLRDVFPPNSASYNPNIMYSVMGKSEFMEQATANAIILDTEKFEAMPDTIMDKGPAYDFYKNSNLSYNYRKIPFRADLQEINSRLELENQTGHVRLRRFYSMKNLKWFFLLWLSFPEFKVVNKIGEDGSLLTYSLPDSLLEFNNKLKNTSLEFLLEDASGKKIKETVIEQFTAEGVPVPDDEKIEKEIAEHRWHIRQTFIPEIQKLSQKLKFSELVHKLSAEAFDELIYRVCILSTKRKELASWVAIARPEVALFVDAPMGLGKTYSIVNTLVEHMDLSAVIFMPTHKLCQDLIIKLKSMLAYKMGFSERVIELNLENIIDADGQEIRDKFGFPNQRFKTDFLQEQVYYADGINKNECQNYDKLIERYKDKWYIKGDICNKCTIKEGCRFRKHNYEAPKSRIVITTHHQYGKFAMLSDIKKWYKDGYYKKDKNRKIIKNIESKKERIDDAPERSFFILDEDFVSNSCYMPIELNEKNLTVCVSTLSEFIRAFDEEEKINDANTLIDNIDKLIAQYYKCDTTSVIPPINPSFKIPNKIKKKWIEDFINKENVLPDFVDWQGNIPNYIEVIEHSIRFGFVVQKYAKVAKAVLLNPTRYNLSGLPPHVFFDGTLLHEKFLRHKLLNVEFEKLKIEIQSNRQLRVWQNINDDLPFRNIKEDETNATQFVEGIIQKYGKERKYFIACSKAVRYTYLENFINSKYPSHHIVICHYGKLRGFNDAENCDVGIILGSFIPSDTVEIAMALEFIQDNLQPNKILATENNLWTLKRSKGIRKYKPEFIVIEELSRSYRLAEMRQAIARTRYLHHNVDFYILSKDPVEEYEPFLQKIETHQYRDYLFPPRKSRNDNKYDPIKNVVMDWLKKNETVNAIDIYSNYGIRRQTVGAYLKKMTEEGLLMNKTKTKYILAEPEIEEKDIES
ncbi:MAG: hypothetical protein WAZ60_20690 [Desulfosalsimonadaceae bacterium]